ncbi:MAG: stage V sporulation protein T [Eubacteriales bacterium]|nr:stage V sporulation protein T [Eubacteriales bacterium]
MKATGIVRRIDELGRVVIPKEIRRTLRIREGDPLEIFTDREGEVILKKYSPVGEMGEIARQFAESLNRIIGHTACVTDRDTIIACAGAAKKDFLEKALHPQMEALMNERRSHQADTREGKLLPVLSEDEDGMEYTAQTVVPIICEGEPIGVVMLLSRELGAQMGDLEAKVCKTVANFIGKQMEQ